MADVRPFPDGEEVPPAGDLADGLAAAVPEADRAIAREILADGVLPHSLRSLDEHPRPRRLAENVYEQVAAMLEGAPPEGRLEVVRRAAAEAAIRAATAGALALAVARYVAEDPNAGSRAGVWLDGEAARWGVRPPEEIAAEASRRLDALEDWCAATQERMPDLWETRRVDYVQAKLALQAARSGSFATASGPLADFLAEVGTPADRLDIH